MWNPIYAAKLLVIGIHALILKLFIKNLIGIYFYFKLKETEFLIQLTQKGVIPLLNKTTYAKITN